jgi:hypothetical protein
MTTTAKAIMAIDFDIDGKSSLQKPQGFEVPTGKAALEWMHPFDRERSGLQ